MKKIMITIKESHNRKDGLSQCGETRRAPDARHTHKLYRLQEEENEVGLGIVCCPSS